MTVDTLLANRTDWYKEAFQADWARVRSALVAEGWTEEQILPYYDHAIATNVLPKYLVQNVQNELQQRHHAPSPAMSLEGTGESLRALQNGHQIGKRSASWAVRAMRTETGFTVQSSWLVEEAMGEDPESINCACALQGLSHAHSFADVDMASAAAVLYHMALAKPGQWPGLPFTQPHRVG